MAGVTVGLRLFLLENKEAHKSDHQRSRDLSPILDIYFQNHSVSANKSKKSNVLRFLD